MIEVKPRLGLVRSDLAPKSQNIRVGRLIIFLPVMLEQHDTDIAEILPQYRIVGKNGMNTV
jgi:hypothetical protein